MEDKTMGTGLHKIFFSQCQKIWRPHNWTQVWLWTQGRVVWRSLYQNQMMGQGLGLQRRGPMGMGRDGSTPKPLPKHLGHETGHLCGCSSPSGCGPACLHWVLVNSMVQGLSSKASAQALEDLFPGLIPVAMSVRICNISALPYPGGN